MRAILVSPPRRSGSHQADDSEMRLPGECRVLVWRFLTLPEQLCCSAVCPKSRNAATTVLRTVGAASRLALAAARGATGAVQLSSLVELVVAERNELLQYIPEVVTLLIGILRCSAVPGASRQCTIESLTQLLGNTKRLSETFVQYDCDPDGPDVLESVVEALGTVVSHEQLGRNALEALVGFLRSVVAGLREAVGPAQGGAWASRWAERERRREQVRDSIAAFNRDPEDWWQQRNLAEPESSVAATARAIVEHGAALDKTRVGNFLSRHKELMIAFLETYDLSGVTLVSAFSHVLQVVCMPGEAQQVDRFCECLGLVWGRANSVDAEVAYIFAFALVMLSTDLHGVRPAAAHDRMTYDQFARNLRCALPKGCLSEQTMRAAYEQVHAGALLRVQKGVAVDQEQEADWKEHLRFGAQRVRDAGQELQREGFKQASTRLRDALLGQTPRGPRHSAQSEKRGAATPRAHSTEQTKGQQRIGKACVQLRRALLAQSAVTSTDFAVSLPVAEGLGDLWRAIWSSIWSSMLEALSSGARAAGQDDDQLEVALRGLQLGCEASAMLGESERANAFIIALQQLSP